MNSGWLRSMTATRSPRRSPARLSQAATWLPRTARSPAVTRSALSGPFSNTITRRSASRAASAATRRLNTIWSASGPIIRVSPLPRPPPARSSVPLRHVVADLGCGRLPAVELVVERLVDVVGDERQVALHRVDVDRALPVLLDAVVDEGDSRFPGPVRHLDLGPVDDVADDVGGERAFVGDDVVVVALRERHALRVLVGH